VRTRVRLLAFVLLIVVAGISAAQMFRIGSAAPENSPWGRALNRLAAEWQRISNGRIRVTVFHNAIAGNEDDMIRKLRIGQLQAVVMTNTGLSVFSDKIMTLSMPLLIRDQQEYEYVFERVRDELEEQIADDGFRVLGWSMAGWLYFFSTDPVSTPEELRQVKIAASPEEMELVRAYQLMGYQAIAIPYTERLAGLVSGMANAYLTVPILAAGFQWFGVTPNMLDLTIGPAPGAILLSERSYRQIPESMRDEFFAVAEEINVDLSRDIMELEQEALDTMIAYGLSITHLTPEERELWIEELEASYDVTLGLVFNEPFYRRIEELLDEFRGE
jgi:TRAP-type C4-dicarboxylate transport system substrate-binding protein